ncbi:hypothetical protein [Sphaerisporangium corydalis]|uniref:Uncharacterized protein n=1 Tax=Sphaerisporangium corydalis TaxID=1441875 RepID=A0ABV9EVR0_9ACTN|nr:hypothetical protein [Sphaerisporangium corydalis]
MTNFAKNAAARIIIVTVFAAGGVTLAATMATADTTPTNPPLTSTSTPTPAPTPIPQPDGNTPWG